MSKSNESQKPLEFDLRDRIAAAIYDGMNEWDRKWAIDPRLTPPQWDEELKSETTCYKIADAVIRELRLQQEWGIKECGETEPGVINFNPENLVKYMRKGEVMMHRYITGWENA